MPETFSFEEARTERETFSFDEASGKRSLPKDIALGAKSGFLGSASDAFRLLDTGVKNLDEFGMGLGLPSGRGGAFGDIANWLAPNPGDAPETFPGKVAEVGSSIPLTVARYLPAITASTATTGTPIPGIVAQSAAEGAAFAPEGEGLEGAAKGALTGLVLGTAGKYAAPLSRPARAAIGAGMGGLLGLAHGQSAEDAAAQALAFGGLAAVPRPILPPTMRQPIAPITEPMLVPKPTALAEATQRVVGPAGAAFDPNLPQQPAIAFPDRGMPRRMSRVAKEEAEAFARAEPESPFPEKAGNIRIEKLDSPEAVKSAIVDTSKMYDEFMPERRGVVSWELTEQLATEMGMTVDDLMKRRKSQAFNAHELEASRGLMQATGRNLSEARDAVLAEESPANLSRLQFALARHAAVQEQVSGATAEAGRALNILRKTASIREEGRRVAEVVRLAGGRDKLVAVARGLKSLETEGQRSRFLKQALPATTAEKVVEAWKAGLLSGPQTHAVNFLSNATTNALNLVEQGVSASARAATGEGTAPLREFAARVGASRAGIVDGLRQAWQALKTEDFEAAQRASETARKPVAIGGTLGKVVRTPFRLLSASDQLWKTLAERQEIYALATRAALSKGLRGDALNAEISRSIESPTAEMRQAAVDHGKYLTFQSDLGDLGQHVQRAIQSHPAAQVVVPFYRTPTNIMKFVIERTPANVLSRQFRTDFAKGGQPRIDALSKIGVGSAIGALVVGEAMEGRISGFGPDDPSKRQALFDSGWRPYSAKIGDQWVSYSRIEPIASIVGLAADYADVAGKATEREMNATASLIALSIGHNLTSKTYVRGLSSLLLALTDREQYAASWSEQMAGSLVPTGVAQIARTQDPTLREIHSVLDAIKTRIPGERETLTPRISPITGKPETMGGSAGPDMLSPFYTSPAQGDSVAQEMVRLGISVGRPDKSLDSEKLDPEQYRAMVEDGATLGHEMVLAQMKSQSWSKMTDDQKSETIRRTYEKARNVVRTKLRIQRYREKVKP